MSKRTLDDLLSAWAARHAPSEADAGGLASRIGDALSQRHGSAPDDGAEGHARGRPHGTLAWAAAAAALLALAGTLLLGRRGGPNGPELPWLASISTAEAEQSGRLFRELETIFAGDLRSAVESGADVRLNVAPLAGGPASDAVPLLVRLTVASRKSPGAEWQKAFEADILTRTEESVEAVPDAGQGTRIVLWACLLPDGKIAVDTSLRLASPLAVSADVSAVLTPGRPKQLLALQTPDGEYRVLLSAVPLPARRNATCSST